MLERSSYDTAMLILDRTQLAESLSMDQIIDAVEVAFRAHADGKSVVPLRAVLETDHGVLLTMPGALSSDDTLPVLAVKVVSVFPNNVPKDLPLIHAAVLLSDAETGKPLALLEGSYLTGLRTGAISGLAAKYLAREDVETLGVIGCGYQAFFQIMAMTCVRSIQRVYLYNRTPGNAVRLANRIKNELELKVELAESAADVARASDLLVTATTSATPVFDNRDLATGCTVIAVGAFTPETREIDDGLIKRANIYVDDREAALSEAGDLLIPIKAGLIDENAIRGTLGELVSGRAPTRQSSEELIFFKSVGLAIEDVAVAQLAYENAKRNGVGTEIHF